MFIYKKQLSLFKKSHNFNILFQYLIINSSLNQYPENLTLEIFVQQCQKHVTKLGLSVHKNDYSML